MQWKYSMEQQLETWSSYACFYIEKYKSNSAASSDQ